MARLSELTDSQCVREALEEFHASGRDDFLSRYSFGPSRDYFVVDREVLVDSKPLVAAAFGKQYPELGPLRATEFSGGAEGAARVLSRLGFDVTTRARMSPPRVGISFASRTAVYERYGGDKVAGIVRFPGDLVVNVFSDALGPYADDPPTLLTTFGYRGEGLSGVQKLDRGGNKLLEQARLAGDPVRFWYRPSGEPFTFLSWIAIVGRNWVAGVGEDRQPRPELEWHLQPIVSPDSAQWPPAVGAARDQIPDIEPDGSVPEAKPAPSYTELVARVESRGQVQKPNGVVRTDYARSEAARKAVLIRCRGLCENPACTGMPRELNRKREPILDVDHIRDLARGGEDHPRNMVALCPNCHAVKTRGANSRRMGAILAKQTVLAHARFLEEEGF